MFRLTIIQSSASSDGIEKQCFNQFSFYSDHCYTQTEIVLIFCTIYYLLSDAISP